MISSLKFKVALLLVTGLALNPIYGQEDEIISLTSENVPLLNGTYHLFSIDSSDITLDRALTLQKYWWRDVENKGDYAVKLEIMDAKHLTAYVLKKNSIIATDKMRFRLENGQLIINRHRLIHCYILFNFFGSLRTTISLTETKSLKLSHHNLQLATLIILPFAGGRENCLEIEFKRRSVDH